MSRKAITSATENAAQDQRLRAAGYCRISSDPNDKREGVTRQRDDITALCEIKGWDLVEFYTDNDRSASNGKDRPEWDRLLEDVKAGAVDAIAAWDQDRGWRMMSELEDLRKFFTSLGREVRFATTGQGDIDLYSPTGVMMAQMKTLVSEHEIAMMRVRMRRAAKQRAENGIPKWKRAFGYLDDTHQPDPRTAPLIVAAYRAMVAGESLSAIANAWNAAGMVTPTGMQWSTTRVSEFLRNPRNAGLRAHTTTGPDGRPHTEIVGPGNWPALVDEPLWHAAIQSLQSRTHGNQGQRRTIRKHRLTGSMRCGKCGDLMGGMRTNTKQIAYGCRGCRGVAIRASDIEPLVLGIVGGRLAKPDAVDLLKAEIHDETEAQRIRDEKAALYSRLDEFALERAQGLMTGRQLQIATEAVQQQISDLDRQEQDQERMRVFDEIPLGTEAALEAVEALSPDRLRAVISVLMNITIQPVGKGGSHVFNPERVKVTPK
jgi:DNA invertase Pin-like site-specific DNA recombinase